MAHLVSIWCQDNEDGRLWPMFPSSSQLTSAQEAAGIWYRTRILYILQVSTMRRPPLWPGGQSSGLQIRRPGFDSRHYEEKNSSGSGMGSTQPREYN
jgi:hypothetical protein